MRNSAPGQRNVRAAHQSKSATVRAAAAAPSRRQRSHWQREQYQQRTLYIAIGALAVVVLAIFGGGLVYDNLIRANQVVAQIGPESISATQLLDEVRPRASAIDAQAKQLGSSSNISSYVDQQKRNLPDQVLNQVVDEHIIQQEAARRGISVSPSELDDKERQTVADYQAATNPTPTPDAAATPDTGAAASTSATPDTGAAAGTSDTGAAPGTSATPAAAALPTPAAATTPTAVPTLDTSAYSSALQTLLDKNNLTEADFRKQLNLSLVRERLQTAIGQEQAPDLQEQVHARQIVAATQEQANALLAQLQGGADFAQLAQQNSTDTATKAQGGDMGWFTRGSQSKAIEDAAFGLQPGQLSDVIQDGAVFRIIQLVERDPARQVPADQLTTQRTKVFNDWLSTQRSSSAVKLSLDPSEKDWILVRIGVRP